MKSSLRSDEITPWWNPASQGSAVGRRGETREEGGHILDMFAVVDIFNRNSPQVNITSTGHITHEVNTTVAMPQYHLSCTARQIKKRSITLHFFSKNTVHRLRQYIPKWKPSRWLLQSFPVAHAEIRLVLLRSGSDTVHDTTLHRTLLSTFLAWCDQPYVWPRSAFDTAMAGCSLQGTANSPSSTAKALYHLTENFATKIRRLLI